MPNTSGGGITLTRRPQPQQEMYEAVDNYDDDFDDFDDDDFYADEDEEEDDDEDEEIEEEEEDDADLEIEENLVGVSYEEGKELLAKALGMSTPEELLVTFDGHADYLHDESRNAAYRRAIDIAAKNSK